MVITIKPKSAKHRNDELGASLIHLAECCPVEGCNPEECPLYQVRKMKRADRLKWFNSLTEDDLNYIAVYHYTCANLKLSERPVTETIVDSRSPLVLAIPPSQYTSSVGGVA